AAGPARRRAAARRGRGPSGRDGPSWRRSSSPRRGVAAARASDPKIRKQGPRTPIGVSRNARRVKAAAREAEGRRAISGGACSAALEVDEAALDVDGLQGYGHAVADVEPLAAAHQTTLDCGADDAHPGTLARGAGDEPVEPVADPVLQQERRRGLSHLALDLGGRVLLVGAV